MKAKSFKAISETKKCPACRSHNLIRLEADVLCCDCDWMSCQAYVDAGGMDNVVAALQEHLGLAGSKPITELPSKLGKIESSRATLHTAAIIVA